MRYETLPQIEARFRNEAAAFLTPFSVPVPNEALSLQGLLYKPDRSGYFHQVNHPKERIVLHFTAGNIRSDMQSLTGQGRHVSVAFVIGRDGTIYQLFPSGYWSGHLGAGVGNQGTGNAQDKATIGIEISNYGYLVPRDGNLETIYSRQKDPKTGKLSPVDPYCPLTTTAAYRKIEQPFREQSYYATCTPEQVESTVILLRYLTAKYNIPRQFLPADKRFITTNDVVNFKGIVSHVNYRSSGKWDIGPAFDWELLISGVQAAAFTPSLTAQRSLEPSSWSPGLTSEEAIEVLFPRNGHPEADNGGEATDNEGYNPNDYETAEADHIPASGELFALLAGINNYDRVPKLGGCINDIEEVEKYLRNRTPFNCHIKTITDDGVTRDNLVRQFDEHLGQAKKGDTVLFYYSGHGALEEADPVWDETDKKLECLVCYDGGATKPADFLLADKELRHLIAALYKKTGAHIVTIFDCCHSGDNTRGALIAAAFDEAKVVKRTVINTSRPSGAFAPREWSDFIFGDRVKKEDVANKTPGVFLPEGVHIQMAACESNQAAVEVGGSGVFTKKLLAVLDACAGNISYNVLRNRIRQYLRFSFEQTPRIYAAGNAAYLLSAGFLNRSVNGMDAIAEATYNKTKGWQLNIGAIHGIDMETKLSIINTAKPDEALKAGVSEVFIDYCLIEIDGKPDKEAVHKVMVQGLMGNNLQLELNNYNGNPKDLEQFVADLEAKGGGHIEFGTAAEQSARPADYTLHVRGGEAIITHPGDPYRPVVRPLELLEPADNAALTDQLRHISKWHFIRQLQNTRIPEGFPEQPLRIEVNRIFSNDNKQALDVSSGTATLEYEQVSHQWRGAVEIKITNTTTQSLYVAALYLDGDFQVFLDFLPQRVQQLESGSHILLGLKGGNKITFSLDDMIREYNWPAGIASLKFIVSTEEFNAEALVMEGLPRPYVLADRSAEDTDRAFEKERKLDTTVTEPVTFAGWMTQTLGLIFKSPVYNQPEAAMLQALLEYPETAYYAAGLYYDVTPDENGAPTLLTLKEGIKVPEEQRGMWADIKIWAGNKIETFQRRRLYNRLKKTDRLRIVAEGDSWFQYPLLVKDILDHLYRVYAVRSYAMAGETLENYMMDREYLDAIGKEEAKFFLVSGGGNDILGAKFRESLRDTPDPGDDTPKKYLNETFFQKVKTLKIWYRDMFAELLQLHPDLHILTHSYDYIIPADTQAEPKKVSWLGKYMIEKNIQPQAEREALIRFIVDAFNEQLEEVVKEFAPRVSYINVRGLTDRQNWYDEIHPGNEGFRLIADRFITEIERIRGAGAKPVSDLQTSGVA
jgi:N-acetyl-anhydromuramyl-L-alanine amidase AmpD